MQTLLIRAILLTAASTVSMAATADHIGKEQHDKKCMSCHKTEVYTRANKTVKTLQALSGQVNNCMKGAAKAEWTNQQTNNVVDYLNSKFYKF